MWQSNWQYLFILLAFASLAYFWWDQTRCRELANSIAMQICKRQNVQFLDGTVVFQKFWPKRSKAGHLQLQRYYAFDYLPEVSESYQDSRKTGFIVLHGPRLVSVGLASDQIQ